MLVIFRWIQLVGWISLVQLKNACIQLILNWTEDRLAIVEKRAVNSKFPWKIVTFLGISRNLPMHTKNCVFKVLFLEFCQYFRFSSIYLNSFKELIEKKSRNLKKVESQIPFFIVFNFIQPYTLSLIVGLLGYCKVWFCTKNFLKRVFSPIKFWKSVIRHKIYSLNRKLAQVS